MTSKDHTSPDALTSLLTNRKQEERTRERSRISTGTSQQIDSFPMNPPQHANSMAQLDHVAAILLEAISLVDEDLGDSKGTYSGSSGEDQSPSHP